jgi:hypothetical protein
MKNAIDTVATICAVITFLGILGLPFISLTFIGIAALKEWWWDREMVWFTKGQAMFFGIFPIGTLVFIICLLLKWIIWGSVRA